MMNEPQAPSQTGAEPKYAGFWLRFCACISDGIILGFPMTLMEIIWNPYGATQENVENTMQSGGSPLEAFSGFFDSNVVAFLVVSTLAYVAYYVYFHASVWQATPGKMLFGLKVVGSDLGRISPLRAFGRYLASWISALVLGIGFIMAAFHPKKRTLHDIMADTYVLDTNPKRSWLIFMVLIVLYIGMMFIKPAPEDPFLNPSGVDEQYIDPRGDEDLLNQ
jgi:uncharacterized RDD family membrane protein YckC